MRFVLALFAAVGLSLTAHPVGAQTPILDRVLERHGASWATTNAMEQQGVTFSAQRQATGPLQRWWQFPEQMRVELRYPDNTGEERVLNGARAWQHGREANAVLQGAIRLQAARLALPRLLVAYGERVEAGESIRGPEGAEWQSLRVPLDAGMEIIVAVDDQGYIRKSEGILRVGGSSVSFATIYDDYRTVDGRLLPFRETHFAMGRQIGHTQLETVRFPTEIAAARFRP